MEINSKSSLLDFIELAIKDRSFANRDVLNIIREATEYFILKEGEILPYNYLLLFNNFHTVEIEPSNKISQHIKFFKDYYKKATLEERFILNNFLFALEILNGNFKKGLKEFLIRSFSFHLHSAYENNEYRLAHTFIKDDLKAPPQWLIETVREIVKNFFKYDKFAQRSFFVHFASVLWNNEIMMNNKIWLEVFDDLVELLDECIKRDLIEEQMYIHFFTYHIYGNNIQTTDEWRIFNEKVEKPASKFYKEWGEKHNLIKPKKRVSTKKKKIGFLIDRVIMNSPWMVNYSLWKSLLEDEKFRENYEIYLYSMNYLDKQQDDDILILQVKRLGVKFYSPQDEFIEYGFYYSHLKKAERIREKIIEDKIDYLISGFGYDIPNFIFSNRSAPKQIFWSHGNCTSEVENIDLRISHFNQECKEFKWKIFNVPMAKEFLVGSEAEKEHGLLIKQEMLKEFGEDTVFLGTIGRLVKIESEEYLKAVSEIMKQNPNTIYLACGIGNIETVKELMQKVGIELNRVLFPGMVNAHIFGWVIDLYLAPFPLLAGQALEEYRRKGKSYVAMHDKKWFENFKKDFSKEPEKFILKELYSQEELEKAYNMQPFLKENKNAFTYFNLRNVLDVEDYINMANRLLKDKELEEKIIKEYLYVIENNRYDINKFLKGIK